MTTSTETLVVSVTNTCLAVDLDDLSLDDAIAVLKQIRETHNVVGNNYKVVYGRYTPDAPKTLLIKEYAPKN